MLFGAGTDEMSSPSESVHSAELVARGVFERSKFGSKPPRAKAKIFQPTPFQGRWELSTFCVDGIDEVARWELLDLHGDRPTVGRCELRVELILEVGLTIEPDWKPERHVNVVGWPESEDGRLSIAQALRDRQNFFLRPAVNR